ncbi:MAG: hypothetical protein ACI37U_09495 [Bacteroides sp.]
MKKGIQYVGIIMMAGLLSLSSAFAQDKQSEINKIKKDRNYLTATGSSAVSKEDALAKAREQIDALIAQWLAENANGDISGYVAKSKESISQIDTQRGSLFRCFVYVKKQEILPYYKGDILITDNLQEQSAAPATDTVPASEVASITVPKETTVPAPVAKPNVEKPVQAVGGISHSGEERAMLDIPSVSALSSYLKRLHRQGKLADFNEATAWPQEGIVYLFVADYNEVIRKRVKVEQGVAKDLKGGERLNLNSLLANYESGTYFWITLK